MLMKPEDKNIIASQFVGTFFYILDRLDSSILEKQGASEIFPFALAKFEEINPDMAFRISEDDLFEDFFKAYRNF